MATIRDTTKAHPYTSMGTAMDSTKLVPNPEPNQGSYILLRVPIGTTATFSFIPLIPREKVENDGKVRKSALYWTITHLLPRPSQEMRTVKPVLQDGWQIDGRPLTSTELRMLFYYLDSTFHADRCRMLVPLAYTLCMVRVPAYSRGYDKSFARKLGDLRYIKSMLEEAVCNAYHIFNKDSSVVKRYHIDLESTFRRTIRKVRAVMAALERETTRKKSKKREKVTDSSREPSVVALERMNQDWDRYLRLCSKRATIPTCPS
ncbi:hypothetical protein BJ508DRAFT_329859 [Ascobolus immersus RN42]|uniref:Uncharacterized protein n=1 Tax=Ascobolus immersus RN42 TaxID=1160509 RepID=A0A3N4I173_ASCIM|nr:hypothetical protein BJ508DRAFT_329859 [Ascobolus immersus RN42]